MVLKETLLEVLPVRELVVIEQIDRQNTDDIRKELLLVHAEYASDYDKIYSYFDTGDIIDTSRDIFDFLKANVPYTKENSKFQTIKNPRAILTFNDGGSGLDRVDCKNYSAFIAGVIDAIKRNKGGDWDWCYRFASYDQTDKEPGHVFVVVMIDGGELWIDPVFPYFNAGDMHEWEIDEKPKNTIGGLYKVICGPGDNVRQTQLNSVIVNSKSAARNFLVAVELGLFGLPQLLMGFPQVTNAQVKQILIDSGVDINALNAVLHYTKKQYNGEK